MRFTQVNDEIHNRTRIRPTINVVTQCNDRVIRTKFDEVDERRQRDGRALEFLGTYDPKPTPAKIDLKLDRVDAWVARGAMLSPTARSLVKQCRRSSEAGAGAGGGQ